MGQPQQSEAASKLTEAATDASRLTSSRSTASMKKALGRMRGRALPKAAARKRKLQRRASEARPEASEAVNMMCVWGGTVHAPVPVWPLWKEEGVSWIVVSEHLYWLRRACSHLGVTHYKELFQSAVSSLRRKLQDQLKKANNPDPAGELRAALDVADDGEASPKRSRCRTEVVKILEVSVDGAKLNKLRPLRVQCSLAAVEALVNYCQSHISKGKPELKKYKAACPQPKHFAMPAEHCPAIIGRVTWQPSVNAWAIHGKRERGSTFTTRIRLVLEKETKSFLAPQAAEKTENEDAKEAFKRERRKRYIEAIVLWNSEDHSSRDRIPVPEE